MAAQAGIWYRDQRPVSVATQDCLSRVNRHLGPDRHSSHVASGLAMLSFSVAFDSLATAERQPVVTDDGFVLTWDGRLDNRDDFIARLGRCADLSDAAIVAEAFSRWGDDTLHSVVGDWSLAHFDTRHRTLSLARDYAGNRPLFYCVEPDFVAWSTAIEALAVLTDSLENLDDTFLAGWLFGITSTNRSYYSNISSVPPGNVVRISEDLNVTIERHTKLTRYTLRYRHEQEYADHYRHLLTEAVRVRLRGSRPIWIELSGGYDSSSLTCIASSLIRAGSVDATDLKPISWIAPGSPSSDESIYIAAVENTCRRTSVKVAFDSPFILPSVGEYAPKDEPPFTQDVAAAEGGHVLISGEFGDMITAPIVIEHVVKDHLLSFRLRSALTDSLSHCRVAKRSLLELFTSVLRNWSDKSSRIAIADGGPPLVVPLLDADDPLLQILRRDFLRRSGPLDDEFSDNENDGSSVSAHNLRRGIGLCSNALSAVHGCYPLSYTFPFAHRPLVEFAMSIPGRVLWSPDHPRAFACTALADVLPEQVVLRRHKGNVGPAFARYISAAVEEEVSRLNNWQLAARGYVDPEPLRAFFMLFLQGSHDNFSPLLRLLLAERFLRRLPGVSKCDQRVAINFNRQY